MVLGLSKHAEVLIILIVVKSSIVTERFSFVFLQGLIWRKTKTNWKQMSQHCDHSTFTNSNGNRGTRVWGLVWESFQHLLVSRTNERGLARLNTRNWGQNTGFITFSIHRKAFSYGSISFPAPCILNIEWNANVTFKLSEGHWKWTALCREYLVWIGGVVRRENVITSKGNLTEEEEGK